MDIAIIGGGAAGFFSAIHAAQNNPNARITIYEGSNKLLSKVLISGGGRCNVTNAIWKPNELAKNYPRGHNHLEGPFRRFNSRNTQAWFEDRGVKLKTEIDGRVFPTTDRSETIAEALLNEVQRLGIAIKKQHRMTGLKASSNGWVVETNQGDFTAQKVVIATGGGPAVWDILKGLDLRIVPPVPSLFTFHCTSPLLKDLAGISLPNCKAALVGSDIRQSGPILITHEGLSGPGILRLSAWAAREIHKVNYKFQVRVNWLGIDEKEFEAVIRAEQEDNPKKYVIKNPLFGIPKRFWQRVCELCDIPENRNFAETGKKQIRKLSDLLLNGVIQVHGKSTNKEEFVTAGGVDLSEIDFDTFQSIRHPGLYMAGEVLDIDAVTGGFNFQAAWTGGYIIGQSI